MLGKPNVPLSRWCTLVRQTPFLSVKIQYRDGHLPYFLARTISTDKSVEQAQVLQTYKRFLDWEKPSCQFRELHHLSRSPSHASLRINLAGYLTDRKNVSKRLCFARLNCPQLNSEVQLVSSPDLDSQTQKAIHAALQAIPLNAPVTITGILRAKPAKRSTSDAPTSEHATIDLSTVEICLTDDHGAISALNEFPSDIILKPDTVFPPKHRHLQLRNDPYIRKSLSLRAKISKTCRELLDRADVVEIETPILFKSTSEGAQEFIVPTRQPGYAYALPQSPQQYKQILMSSGLPRYYQFARCFRDEDLRADRQPEFTQLDLELAFADASTVISLVEDDIVRPLWKSTLDLTLASKFPRLPYHDAISNYGSDKPDLRIPIAPFVAVEDVLPEPLIKMITALSEPRVEAMIVSLNCSANDTKAFVSHYLDSSEGSQFTQNPDGGPGIFIYDGSKPMNGLSALGHEAATALEEKFSLESGNLLILQARTKSPNQGGNTALGRLRTKLFERAVSAGLLPALTWMHFEPLWVVDFPLFSPTNKIERGQGGSAGLMSTHHPFTSPKTTADVDRLFSDPAAAIGDHYDLVINGEEIGGGSRRIHHAAMQELIFRDILRMEESKVAEFSHLLSALRAGCPPHAGLALGFDRLVAMLASAKFGRKLSMRDVIAFPKSGRGQDLMMGSPSRIHADDLKTYHLKQVN